MDCKRPSHSNRRPRCGDSRRDFWKAMRSHPPETRQGVLPPSILCPRWATTAFLKPQRNSSSRCGEGDGRASATNRADWSRSRSGLQRGSWSLSRKSFSATTTTAGISCPPSKGTQVTEIPESWSFCRNRSARSNGSTVSVRPCAMNTGKFCRSRKWFSHDGSSTSVPDKTINAESGTLVRNATSLATIAPWENPPRTSGPRGTTLRYLSTSSTREAADLRPTSRVPDRSGIDFPGGMCDARSSGNHARASIDAPGSPVRSGPNGKTNRPVAGHWIVCVNGIQRSAEEPYPWSSTSVGGPSAPWTIVASLGGRLHPTALSNWVHNTSMTTEAKCVRSVLITNVGLRGQLVMVLDRGLQPAQHSMRALCPMSDRTAPPQWSSYCDRSPPPPVPGCCCLHGAVHRRGGAHSKRPFTGSSESERATSSQILGVLFHSRRRSSSARQWPRASRVHAPRFRRVAGRTRSRGDMDIGNRDVPVPRLVDPPTGDFVHVGRIPALASEVTSP